MDPLSTGSVSQKDLAQAAAALGGGAQIPYGTSLPANPSDGQQAFLVDSITNPTYAWCFRYNAGSTSPYKWEFIGGSDAYQFIGTQEGTTTVGSWLDLATVGPRIVVPRAGDYEMIGSALGMHSAASAQIWISPYLGSGTAGAGSNTITPSSAGSLATPLQTVTWRQTVAAADDIRLRYYNSTAGTATFWQRWIRVRPLRVS